MESKVMCSDDQANSKAKVEQALWAALLHAEGVACAWKDGEPLTEDQFTVAEDPQATIPYVWNPAAPEAEPFFAALEQALPLDDWNAAEVATRSDVFFAQVNQLWSTATLQETLTQRFAARVPQQLLTAIATRAQQVLSSSISLADQLVQCVQEALPHLAEDDLHVLARPLAYAMRGNDSPVESTLERVRSVEWDALSDVEQARLSLAIARYALAELESEK
ncbi:hypothetical protein H6F86_03465 [Phormidium sp. FACHB-592]|uniref:Uncharacterized protein n=1 Tax=Stenomitos frigidus AS-A4 TaxID=2933935 RepID=A0ABV0KQX3_9CYAN|nr:hypothetical protein [Phormidium sp. FACHB-592]MBD2072958.1 hypothetical protein [Phormidium sp. FACHB-592]